MVKWRTFRKDILTWKRYVSLVPVCYLMRWFW
jgi:hypothetical protein